MKALSVLCNHCGAPLQLKDSIRYTTCSHCGSHLKIQHSGGSAHSELLEDMRTYKALEFLDRDWEQTKEKFTSRDKDGVKTLPTRYGWIAGIVAAAFGIFWSAMAYNMSQESGGFDEGGPFKFFWMFGLLFVAFGIYIVFKAPKQYVSFKEAERLYTEKREALLQRLDQDQS